MLKRNKINIIKEIEIKFIYARDKIIIKELISPLKYRIINTFYIRYVKCRQF
jgi:hypothetical protein